MKPQRELPAATGFYWCRNPAHPSGWFVLHISHDTDDMGGPMLSGLPERAGSIPARRWPGLGVCEWWPERIEEPTTEGEANDGN